MTRAQRRVLERALKHAEKGPSFGLSAYGKEAEAYFANQAKIWAESWIAPRIKDVLKVEDGELSSRMLLYAHPDA